MPSVDLMPTTVIRVARLLLRMGFMVLDTFQLHLAFFASISVVSVFNGFSIFYSEAFFVLMFLSPSYN
jgi:hypothetical protein